MPRADALDAAEPAAPAPRPIRFWHRGAVVEVQGQPTTRTVLDWLREDARCTGTKEGCNEGDCGACTVVVAELVADDGDDSPSALALAPVNACIRLLPTLDGRALFTVEDLTRPGSPAAACAKATGAGCEAGAASAADAVMQAASAHGPATAALHPVQQALVECHGSQCGFCTPGFVMSLWASSQRHGAAGTRPTRQQLADDLSGNLCRCTGYRPILDAGERLFDNPPPQLDAAPVAAALRALAAQAAGAPLRYEHGGARYEAPRELAALAATLQARPQARVLAGSTDIGLWVTKQQRALPDLVWVGEVAELRVIEILGAGQGAGAGERPGGVNGKGHDEGNGTTDRACAPGSAGAPGGPRLSIGAAVTLEAGWAALAQHWPALGELWRRFAGLPTRMAGTLVGNLANGSPIGDTAPALLALDAVLRLRRGDAVRHVPLHAFYLDYMKNALQPGEFIEAVEVPLAAAQGGALRAYKISKRFDCDISALCAAMALKLDGAGRVADVRLAFGGMAATVRRATQAEATLRGAVWDEAAVQAAQAALARDFTPLSDLRGSAAYRRQTAAALLRRFWLETRPVDPLPAGAVSVWAQDAAA